MKRPAVLITALLVLTLAVGLVARRYGWLEPARVGALAMRMRHGHDLTYTAPIFVVVFAVATAVGVPGVPFMLAAGVVFDPVVGTGLSIAGVLLGGLIGYGVARRLGRGALDRYLGRHRHVERLMHGHPFWTLVRLRLLPVVPLGVGNILAGLARVPVSAFLLGTLVGVGPFAALYAYLASSLLWGAEATRRHVALDLVLASLALVGVSFIPALAKRLRRSRKPFRSSTGHPAAPAAAVVPGVTRSAP